MSAPIPMFLRLAARSVFRRDKATNKAAFVAAIRERARSKKKPRKRIAPPAFPRAAEMAYARDLVAIAGIARQVLEEKLNPSLDRIFEAAKTFATADAAGARRDQYATILSDVFGELEVEFEKRVRKTKRTAAKKAANRTEETNEKELSRYTKQLVGVDVVQEEPWLADFTELFIESNVGLIESIGTRLHGEVRELVESAAATGLRPEALAEDIQERFGVSESRARLIARDQVGKYNGMLSAARQQRLGIRSFIWRTSGDERVRDSHAAKEGNTYEWQDPPHDTGMPGEDYQCRCTAEPDLEALADEIEGGDDRGDAAVFIARLLSVMAPVMRRTDALDYRKLTLKKRATEHA
jgi:SPP1 gp7 family putative phage head morphogenesis protein